MFCSCCYHELSRAFSLHLLFCSSVHASSALPGPLSTVTPFSGDLAHPCPCLFSLLDCVVPARALLRSRTAARLALVIVRTLALTNPGPPLSHAANPNMHRSSTAVLVPGMAIIVATHFIPEFTSDVSSCTKCRPRATCLIQVAKKFHVILVLLSAPPVLILVRRNI